LNKHFFIDLDDTLVECSYLYSLATFKLGVYLYELLGNKIPYVEHLNLVKTRKKIDLKLFEQMGINRKRFPTSLVLTYRKICENAKIKVSKKIEKDIWQIGEIPFDMNYYKKKGLIKGVIPTLEFLLNQQDSLHIVTFGDVEVQQDKIKVLELKKYFGDNITVESKKDKALYNHLTQKLNKKNCFMIGNSLRGDITPSLEAGLNAIYIPSIGSVWSYEDGSEKPNLDFFEFKKFSDIKRNYDLLI